MSEGYDRDEMLVQVSLASPAGACTVEDPSLFHFILRLGESIDTDSADDREALDVLRCIPHALEPDEEMLGAFGRGWRVVPPRGALDWPVLEATPQCLRSAFRRAHDLLWSNANFVRVSAREIAQVEHSLETIYGVLSQAEAAGVAVSISYVA
ncbi:MAG TPA: hypothetical protein VMV73_05180 [Candidatus Dormibacteraeota bacterium]|nr:hypothetical protein [Candidatus Dormibacteraeota bacterium]